MSSTDEHDHVEWRILLDIKARLESFNAAAQVEVTRTGVIDESNVAYPFIDIRLGEGVRDEDVPSNLTSVRMPVEFDVYVQADSGEALREALRVQARIHDAVASDRTWSGRVIDSQFTGASPPEPTHDGAMPAMARVVVWELRYRTKYDEVRYSV